MCVWKEPFLLAVLFSGQSKHWHRRWRLMSDWWGFYWNSRLRQRLGKIVHFPFEVLLLLLWQSSHPIDRTPCCSLLFLTTLHFIFHLSFVSIETIPCTDFWAALICPGHTFSLTHTMEWIWIRHWRQLRPNLLILTTNWQVAQLARHREIINLHYRNDKQTNKQASKCLTSQLWW